MFQRKARVRRCILAQLIRIFVLLLPEMADAVAIFVGSTNADEECTIPMKGLRTMYN